MINGKKSDKIYYSPVSQRFKPSIVKLTYFLTAFNLIVFIWLMISSNQTVHYNPKILWECNESTVSLRLLNNRFISFWQDTSFWLSDQCLKSVFTDDTFNFIVDINRIKQCQSDEVNNFWQSPNDFFTFLPMKILLSSQKKIVSFSLYGGADRYLHNVIKIIRRYKKLLPGWTPRFWLGSDVPFVMINRLILEDVEVIIVHQRKPTDVNVTRSPGFHGMFWRFFVSDDEHVERYIVRDSDSMLIQREVDAINQWIEEKTTFHVMRDHPEHAVEILGGMWGGKVHPKIFSASREYAKALKEGYNSTDHKGLDQEFLKRYLWPIARKQMTCHTAYRWKFVDSRGCKDFPTKREGTLFIGAIMEN